MRTNSIYVFILMIVMAAWFSQASVGVIAKQNVAVQEPTQFVAIDAIPNLATMVRKPGGKCNIESINGVAIGKTPLSVHKDRVVIVAGWVFDDANSRVPDSVWIELVGEHGEMFVARVYVDLQRPDVRAHFGLDHELAATGFHLTGYMHDVISGSYQITLIFESGSEIHKCVNGRSIVVI